MSIAEFWQRFLVETAMEPHTTFREAFSFGNSEELANSLLALVLSGEKRATSSSLWAYEIENEPLPKAGDFSIVTDWAGNPHYVIRTTAVTVLPFRDMTFEICRREGEDSCLESWQKNHIAAYMSEGQEVGYTFSTDMPVVFEDFDVVYPLGNDVM